MEVLVGVGLIALLAWGFMTVTAPKPKSQVEEDGCECGGGCDRDHADSSITDEPLDMTLTAVDSGIGLELDLPQEPTELPGIEEDVATTGYLEEVDEDDDEEDTDYPEEDSTEFDLLQVLPDVVYDPNRHPGPRPHYRLKVVIGNMPDGDSGHADELESGQSAGRYVLGEITSIEAGLYPVDSVRLRHNIGDHLEFRLCGADTYESDQGEAGAIGTELADDLMEGQEVELLCYDNDDYGRVLCTAIVPVHLDGEWYDLDFSAVLVRLGAGVRYAGSKHEEGAWYQEHLDQLEALAQEEERGAWGLDPLPTPPHVHRRQGRRRKRNSDRRPPREHRVVEAAASASFSTDDVVSRN